MLLDLMDQRRHLGDDLPPELEIDCSGVEFFGSAGLTVLVKFRTRVERRVALLSVSP